MLWTWETLRVWFWVVLGSWWLGDRLFGGSFEYDGRNWWYDNG